MAETYKNKIIFNGQTLIDLTGDTVTESDLAQGVTAHDKTGKIITGTSTYDADTSNDSAVASEILATKTAHARGTALTGTMTNNGAVSATITSLSPYTVPQGYHDGSGTVSVDSTNISAGNIKSGVTILGVEGEYTGAAITTQSKTVTPTTQQQIVTADTAQGYDYLAQVTVNPIPYTETANQYGITVTIG